MMMARKEDKDNDNQETRIPLVGAFSWMLVKILTATTRI